MRELLTEKKKEKTIAYHITIIITLYQLLTLWTATYIVDEQFLRRKIEYDLGHEIVEEIINDEAKKQPNLNNYCKQFPIYSQMQVEQNGFSCHKLHYTIFFKPQSQILM